VVWKVLWLAWRVPRSTTLTPPSPPALCTGLEACDFYGKGTLVMPQLGDPIAIFWPKDRCWYEGTVEGIHLPVPLLLAF
jgi:hypothetical protein